MYKVREMELRVTSRSEVSKTEARSFVVAGCEIVLCEVDGEVYALEGICTHEELSLDGGEVEDGVLECPWHGARYEVCTGRVRALPATRPLRTYPVRVDAEGNVYVTLPE
jgi:3-phenylpropionate/trans-cinnamate dioxygenase ferredoxin subunit